MPTPGLHKPEGNGKLNDEQLAMPFVVPKRAEAQPFLKWAGGKASLLRQLEELFPHEVDRYIEPFLGGGAVFFHLKHRFPDMRPLLRDSNKELINCYRVVRDRPEDRIRPAPPCERGRRLVVGREGGLLARLVPGLRGQAFDFGGARPAQFGPHGH